VLFYSGRNPAVKRLDLARATMDAVVHLRPQARLQLMDGAVPPECVPVMMNAADCLLLTSDYEGSPTVVQEAKACNLPVVSVGVGDVARQLDGVANCHVVASDVHELAEAVADVLASGRRSDGARFLTDSDLETVARSTEQLYRRLLERSRGSTSVAAGES
jgi:teichuronic acid biosynthesis glycosyltransferase TuaC